MQRWHDHAQGAWGLKSSLAPPDSMWYWCSSANALCEQFEKAVSVSSVYLQGVLYVIVAAGRFHVHSRSVADVPPAAQGGSLRTNSSERQPTCPCAPTWRDAMGASAQSRDDSEQQSLPDSASATASEPVQRSYHCLGCECQGVTV
jgi:hypothetical protein